MLPSSPSQQSQWGHPSTNLQGFFLSDLIDCSNGHVAACTHAIQDPQMDASTHQHGSHTHCRSSHTSQTHLFWAFPQSQHSSGRISPTAPTAFNQLGHEALQMGLSVGWDCRGRVGEGGGIDLVIVNIFCAPSPPSSTSPPVLYCVTLLRDSGWTAWATLALPYSAHAFLRLSLFQSFTS